MEDVRKQLVAAIQTRSDEATLRSLAQALAPRKPAEQVIALIELENDMAPERAELETRAKALAAEIAKLDSVKSTIRGIITHTMESRSLAKVDTGYCTISLVQGRESMDVVAIDEVADEFARVVRQADKKAAMAHLKATGVVPSGFDFKRGDPYITVRAKKNIR